MPKFDDFDLDVQKTTEVTNSGVEPRITSVALCTPGTCNNDCKPTSWLCSDVCVTKTCITCV